MRGSLSFLHSKGSLDPKCLDVILYLYIYRYMLYDHHQQIVLKYWGIVSLDCSPSSISGGCSNYLSLVFASIVLTVVYIPRDANTNQALDELYGFISGSEPSQPEASGLGFKKTT